MRTPPAFIVLLAITAQCYLVTVAAQPANIDCSLFFTDGLSCSTCPKLDDIAPEVTELCKRCCQEEQTLGAAAATAAATTTPESNLYQSARLEVCS